MSVFHPGGPPQHEKRRSRKGQNQPLPGKLWLNVSLMKCKKRSSPRWKTLTRNLKSKLSVQEAVVSATLLAFQVIVVYCLSVKYITDVAQLLCYQISF